MKRLIAFFIIIGLCACKEDKPKIESIETEELTSKQIDSILTDFNFQYDSPIVLDSTNQVLIPISTELLERRAKYSKDGYYSEESPKYWNVIFYNLETRENNLLTEGKISISQIHAIADQYGKKNKLMKDKVFYEIREVDFNKDGKLNSLDPQYLFSSETNGTNLKRISPENEDLQFFKIVPDSKQILFRTLRDTNKDAIFNREDESVWYKAELANMNWETSEVIDATGRQKIETLYFEQWLKKK